MPIAISKLLKRDVFATQEGLRLGRAQDVLIDRDEHRIALVVLSMRGVPQTATVIEADDVHSWAEDTLPIDSVKATHLAHEVPNAIDLVQQNLQFRGRDVYSSSGHKLGRIVDVIVDEKGNVTEYKVASNLFKRLFHITESVAPANVRTAGGDVAVVSEPSNAEASSGASTEAQTDRREQVAAASHDGRDQH